MSGGRAPDRTFHAATATRPAWLGAGDPANPVVLLLHGATMDMAMFDQIIAAFQDEYRLLAVDLPGHGRSAAIPFSVDNCVEGVLELLNEEQIGSCHLVGQSMGGIICQLLVQRRPGVARSAALISSVPLSAPIYRLAKPAFFILKLAIRILPLSVIRRFIAVSAGSTPTTRDYIRLRLSDFDKAALCRIVSEIGGALKAGSDPVIAPAVLLVNGSRDWIAFGLNRLLVYRWARRCGYPLHRISGASHNANMDRPQAVNRLILEHLESRAGA
jgi:pimeloyl-ACP methyl ester carboxylesterase